MTLNKRIVILLFLSVPLAFRNVLETTLGNVGTLVSIMPLLIATMAFFFIALRSRIANYLVLPIVYIIYCFVCVLLFPLVGLVDHTITPYIGFFQLVSPIFLSITISHLSNSNDYNQTIINGLVAFGLLNAIGGVVQFFISPSLFGLISNRVYDGLGDYLVTRRAISFLASPQSLSIYLAFSITLIRFSSFGKVIQYISYAFMLFCGILTGSKAFFIYLICYSMFFIDIKKVFLLVSPVFVLLACFFGRKTGFETFDRVLDIPYKIINIEQYLTFQIWSKFIFFPSSIEQFIIGRGIGTMSTASQTLNNYTILNGSTESFILQLYFELGLLGLLFFLVMFIYPLVLIILQGSSFKPIAISVLALLSNMMFTPAFYGFTTAFLFYLAFFVCIKDVKIINFGKLGSGYL